MIIELDWAKEKFIWLYYIYGNGNFSGKYGKITGRHLYLCQIQVHLSVNQEPPIFPTGNQEPSIFADFPEK